MESIIKNRCKIHISDNSIVYLCLMLAVIAENECFRLFQIDTIMLKFANLLMIYISFFIVIFRSRKKHMKLSDFNFLYCYLAVIAVFLVVQYIYTTQLYRAQSLFEFLKMAQGYSYVVMVIPLFYLFQSGTGLDKIMDSFKILVFITLTVMIIAAFFYNTRGINIFPIDFYMKYMRRNNRLRILDLSSMEGLIIIWTFYELLCKKKKKCLNAVILIVSFGALLYVEQARVMQISVILSLGVMYLLKSNRRRNAILMKIICICVIAGYIIFSGRVGDVINSFNVNGDYGSSTKIRLDEIKHAIQLISKYYINGVGLAAIHIGNYYSSYIGRGNFGMTDIGLLGLITQIGLWTIPVYIYPMFRFFNILLKIKNRDDKNYFLLLCGLFLYLLMTSITIIIINQQRIYVWPMIICIFEYSYAAYKSGGGQSGE